MTATLALCLLGTIWGTQAYPAYDDDAVAKPIDALVVDAGFSISNHSTMTDDGCELTVFRVRDPRFGDAPLPPLLLQHGILDSADAWTLNGANGSLAMLAAAAGFDVFLGNSRGNKYSSGRAQFAPHSKDYWLWSWDEMAKYDLPATLELARDVSGCGADAGVPIACHSQGCTLSLVAMLEGYVTPAEAPLVVALAPVAHMRHSTSELLEVVSTLRLDELLELLRKYSFLPDRPFFEKLLPQVCARHVRLCDDVASLLVGYNASHIDESRWPVFLSHFPSGTSAFDLSHYAQALRADRDERSFAAYDYEWGLALKVRRRSSVGSWV